MKKNRILAILLAMVLTFATGITVFAGPVPTGTEASPAKVFLSKELVMAEGVNTPNLTFTFKFAKHEEDGATPTAVMPAISDKTISYTAADTAPVASGLIKVKKLSTDLVAGLTFGHAGVFSYKVTEDSTAPTVGSDETLTFSQAKYTMNVGVALNAAGTGTYVKYVEIIKDEDDDGSPATGKVDGNDDLTDNGFTFKNIYTRDGNSVGPSAGGDALVIDKTVTGDGGDLTKDFDFSLTLTKSATEATTVTSYAAKLNKGGVVTPVTVNVGTPYTFTLKHGESLVFENLPAGTKYTVEETADATYTTTIDAMEDGTAINVAGVNSGNKLVGDEENYSQFKNDRTSTPPTGILLKKLPFILIGLMAIGGIILFALKKKRELTA